MRVFRFLAFPIAVVALVVIVGGTAYLWGTDRISTAAWITIDVVVLAAFLVGFGVALKRRLAGTRARLRSPSPDE